MEEFKASLHTAWDTGEAYEVYFNLRSGGQEQLRMAVYERQGKHLVNEVYAVPSMSGVEPSSMRFNPMGLKAVNLGERRDDDER